MLATRLVALRKAKNLKQDEVARELGITRPTYATYEQGRRDPSSETLIKLAEFFRCSTDYLLGLRELDVQQSESAWPQELRKTIVVGPEFSFWRNEEDTVYDNVYGKKTTKRGEVYLAEVMFHDFKSAILRPVIVVSKDVVVAAVTNVQPVNEYDVVLEHWDEAGLLRPSIARTSQLFSHSGLQIKLGELHPKDLDRVLQKCRELF